MTRDWQRLFPSGKVVLTKSLEGKSYHIPLADGRWFQLSTSHLTDREVVLLDMLLPNLSESKAVRHPWQDYLCHKGKLPDDQVDSIQYLHVSVTALADSFFDKSALMATLTAIFPNDLTWFEQDNQLIIVLNQTVYFSIFEQVLEVIQVLEADFDCQLTMMLGQIWNNTYQHEWGELLVKESEVYRYYLTKSRKHQVFTLVELLYWLVTEKPSLVTYFLDRYQNMILQLGMDDLILALWEEKGIQTKAAKRLFLHRNTLQHRLERFEELTGLDLKKMTDLAVVHLASQNSHF